MTNWNERANEVEQNSQDTRRQRSRSRARNEQIEDILKEIGPLTVENLTAKREENRKNPGMYGVDDNWFYQQLRRLGSTPDVPPDTESAVFHKPSEAKPAAPVAAKEEAPPVAFKQPVAPTRVATPKKEKGSFLDRLKEKYNSLDEKTQKKVLVGAIAIGIILFVVITG